MTITVAVVGCGASVVSGVGDDGAVGEVVVAAAIVAVVVVIVGACVGVTIIVVAVVGVGGGGAVLWLLWRVCFWLLSWL